MAIQIRENLSENLGPFPGPSWGLRRRRTPASPLRLPPALAQIVLGSAHAGAGRGGVGVEGLFGDRDHPAVLAHLEHVESAVGAAEHPVLAGELGGDAFDRALGAERFAATGAAERLLLLEHAGGGAGRAEIELRSEPDHLFRAGRLAQAALHASVLGEAQGGAVGIVSERAGWAGGDAGEAERAAFDIDLALAEARARGKRDHVD